MRNDWMLLRAALRNFGKEFAHAATQLEEMLTTGKRRDAERMVHTIKGLAKSVGATELQQVSE